MSHHSQLFIPDIPVHVILRSNNSRPCFYDAEDYRSFLQCLQVYAAESSCNIHAYVLMSNHVHLLLTPDHDKSVVGLINPLCEYHSQYINRIYLKSGSLLGKRISCYLIHEKEYFLECQKYIELNPIRSNIVSSPGEYPWSSYRANALGVNTSPISHHPLYLLLGNSKARRMEVYRELFAAPSNYERVFSPGWTEKDIRLSNA